MSKFLNLKYKVNEEGAKSELEIPKSEITKILNVTQLPLTNIEL